MSEQGERLSVERSEFMTSDPEEAWAAVNEMYGGYRPKISGSTEDFTFGVRRTHVGDLSLDRVVHSMRMAAECDPFNYLLFLFPTAGSLGVEWGGQEMRVGVGDACLFPVGTPFEIRFTPHRVEALSLPLEAAEDVAAEEHGPGVRFTGMMPVSPAADRLWRSTVGFVSNQLETPRSAISEPLVRAETRALLAAAAIETFPNTTMTEEYLPTPGQAGRAALRRAEDFIEAYAGRPLALSEIAAAASTSPQALTSAFARKHGTGPTGYLHRVRLEYAHRDLKAADPTETTVAEIGARWGFLEPDDFAAVYRDAYRRSPGMTLST